MFDVWQWFGFDKENQPDAECWIYVNFTADEINGFFFTIFKLSHEEHELIWRRSKKIKTKMCV